MCTDHDLFQKTADDCRYWFATNRHEQTLSLCAPMGGAAYQTKYLGDFRVAFDYFFPSVFRDEFKAFEVPAEAI